MAYEQRDNSGTVFNNDRKESPNHPDRSGSAMIDGVEYWVSGWVKNGAKGQFLSLAFKKKEQRGAQRSLASKGRPADPDSFTDDDMKGDTIPF